MFHRFLAAALILISWAAVADDNAANSVGDAAHAYYICVSETAIKMASASSEPAATLAKNAKSKCVKPRVAVSDALNQGKAAGRLTDIGIAKLSETVEKEATNNAIASVNDLRSTNSAQKRRVSKEQQAQMEKSEDEKTNLLGDCLRSNTEKISVNPDKSPEYIAKVVIAMCSDEVNAFAEADAQLGGHPASLATVEAVKKRIAANLIKGVNSTRAAAK